MCYVVLVLNLPPSLKIWLLTRGRVFNENYVEIMILIFYPNKVRFPSGSSQIWRLLEGGGFKASEAKFGKWLLTRGGDTKKNYKLRLKFLFISNWERGIFTKYQLSYDLACLIVHKYC